MEIWKEVIRPATYTYINPSTGLPERLKVTPDQIKHYHDQGNAMIAAGLSIPVPLEHQPDAKPMTSAERAAANLRNLGGDTKKYEIRKVKEGDAEKEALFACLDVTDPTIAEKIQNKTLKWVSPWINSFVDGAGKAWNNVVSHIALTATPRITKQTPFESVGAAMSLIGSLADVDPAKGVFLSAAGRLTESDGKLKPACPAAFSLMTGIKLSKEEFDDLEDEEDDEPDGDETMGGDEPEDAASSEESTLPGSPADATPPMSGESKDIAIHDLLADLLAIMDIHLPSGTTAESFEHGLYEALMMKVKDMGGKVEDDGEELGTMGAEPEKAGSKNPVMQESPPMYMSIQEINAKVKDPKERKLHAAMLSLHNQAKSAEKYILDEANKKRTARVESIAKRLPVGQRDKLIKLVTSQGAMLSLVAGAVVDPVAEMVDLYADLARANGPDGVITEQPQPPDGVEYNASKYEKSGYLPARG